MLKNIIIITVSFLLMTGSMCAQQLDSTVRIALDSRLAEYFSAIERAGTDVQKGECDFLIETCTDSLMRQHVAVSVYEHYRDSKVMGSEAVAIHVFDTWFKPGKVKMRSDSDLFAAGIFAEFNRQSLIGNKAPELLLYDVETNPVTLFSGGISGRYSVLYFYDTSCATCKLQTIMLRNLFEQEDFPVNLYAVYAGDDRDAWTQYIDEQLSFNGNGTEISHLWDPEISSDFQRKYGVIQTPRMYLIAPDGTILGRGLDVQSLSQMLHIIFDEVELVYGSDESIGLYDGIFGDVSPSKEEVVAIADYIRAGTLEKGDTLMYRQMTGDLMYYLALQKGEGFREGLYELTAGRILKDTDVWESRDDSLKVLGMAGMYKELLSKNMPGVKVADMKLPGVLLSKGKDKTGTYRLRKLRGTDNYLMFVTDGCHVCAAEKEAARTLAASDKSTKVMMINVDDVLSVDPALASQMFDSFDLSALPFIIHTDRKGFVKSRYITFLE